MHVNCYDPETYLWILQECDVPYVPDEWNKIVLRKQASGDKITPSAILGRYLSVMKLSQWKKFRWKDNELIKELEEKRITETMSAQGYTDAQIAEQLAKGSVSLVEPPRPTIEEQQEEESAGGVPIPKEEDEEDFGLTQEDIQYLTIKWGKSYRQHEWVYLEKLYNDMITSYDIQQAGHIDTLKMLCKTSLKCNQLVDLGDVEGFQKMSKVYDMLMRSGNFTANQNKIDSGDFVDSIGELVELCEKEGFIPRYYIEKPNDRVDETLQDLKQYTYSLVTEEMNLGNLIEGALKEMQKEEEKEEDLDYDIEEMSLEDLDNLTHEELQDTDYEEYLEFIEEEKEM